MGRGLGALLVAAGLVMGCAAASADEVRAAIDAGDRTALKAALAKKPSLEPVCEPYEICKPLAAAASRGDLAMVKMLVEAGADPNGRNAYNDIAFMLVGDLASAKGLPATDLPAIRAYLLEHGTDPNLTNQFDVSVISGCAAQGDIALLEIAYRRGGRINGQSPKRRATPLMMAAGFGEIEAVRWLLAHGADPALRDVDGETARSIARREGHMAVVALLPE